MAKSEYRICGMKIPYFVVFFVVVMITVYMGFMPTVNIYSNEAGSYVATDYVATVAFLMAVGGLLYWIGGTVPILNDYLGGVCLLPLLGCSFMVFVGLVPDDLKLSLIHI